MRIDSCRKCGLELTLMNKCDECNQPIQFQCTKCLKSTDKQIHYKCNHEQPKISLTS